MLLGVVNVIVASPLLPAALALVGAPGVVGIVTEFDAVDDTLVPTAFVAVTVKVYVAPGVNPVTVIGDDVPVALNVFVLSVTVKLIIEEPPVEDAVKEIVACPMLEVAMPIVGAPGTVAGVDETILLGLVLVPAALIAYTSKLYDVPLINPTPTTVAVVDVPETNPSCCQVDVDDG